MTQKQKWFITKLLKEIKENHNEDLTHLTNYGDSMFDGYRVSSKQASDDISKLLKYKELMDSGKTYDEAFDIIERG